MCLGGKYRSSKIIMVNYMEFMFDIHQIFISTTIVISSGQPDDFPWILANIFLEC